MLRTYSPGFTQNMTVPPSLSSKYLRPGSAAVEFVSERYNPMLCEKIDSDALPSCEASTICGVSPGSGHRTE